MLCEQAIKPENTKSHDQSKRSLHWSAFFTGTISFRIRGLLPLFGTGKLVLLYLGWRRSGHALRSAPLVHRSELRLLCQAKNKLEASRNMPFMRTVINHLLHKQRRRNHHGHEEVARRTSIGLPACLREEGWWAKPPYHELLRFFHTSRTC